MLHSSVAGLAQENARCPVMVDSETDPDCAVEYEGVRVGLCCAKCSKIWEKNPKYVIKVSLDLLPQFQGREKELGLDAVELLAQRFCPILTTAVVTPDSPSVDYKGVKIRLFDEKAKSRWLEDPDGCAKRALEAGLLPQLTEKPGGVGG